MAVFKSSVFKSSVFNTEAATATNKKFGGSGNWHAQLAPKRYEPETDIDETSIAANSINKVRKRGEYAPRPAATVIPISQANVGATPNYDVELFLLLAA